jgi:fatty-acyl-CoA synthase
MTRRCRMTPHRTALVFEDRSWTYAALKERVDRLAQALHSLGVRFGDRVGYLGPNNPAFLELLFAAGSLGAIPVPINFRMDRETVAYIVQDAGCQVLVYAPEVSGTAAWLRTETRVPCYVTLVGGGDSSLHDYEQLLASASPEPLNVPVDLDDVGLMVYTSGTTGRPKGVMLTHGNLTWNAFNFLISGDFRGDDVSLAIAPFFRVGGLAVTLLETLLVGGTVVLMSIFDPGEALRLIDQYRVTVLFGGPELLQALEDYPSFPESDFSTLRVCYTGGSPVPEHLIHSYLERGIPILQGYGLSEAAPLALLLDPEDMTRKIGSAGRPPFFTDVRVVRADLTDVAPGEVGEVLVAGPNVMKGYWNRPDATEETVEAGGWLRTGDAARVDDEGYVYIVGRVDDAYVTSGRLVHPDDLERVLLQHSAVRETAVVGIPDDKLGEIGIGFVVPADDRNVTEDDLFRWAVSHLNTPEILHQVRFIDTIPRNPAGKVLRHELRQRAMS